jgi:hypothetical protein
MSKATAAERSRNIATATTVLGLLTIKVASSAMRSVDSLIEG